MIALAETQAALDRATIEGWRPACGARSGALGTVRAGTAAAAAHPVQAGEVATEGMDAGPATGAMAAAVLPLVPEVEVAQPYSVVYRGLARLELQEQYPAVVGWIRACRGHPVQPVKSVTAALSNEQ